MAQQGILWQLVTGFNPGAAYTQGLQQYNQQQNILQQLAGQDQDRQFNRDKFGQEFQYRQTNDAANRALQERQLTQQAQNAAASQGIQRAQLDLQRAQFQRGEVPAGYERDPNDPTRLRPRVGGPEDPSTISARIRATKEPVAPQFKEVEINGQKTLVRINPDNTVIIPDIQGAVPTPTNPFAPTGKMTNEQATAALYADRIHSANEVINQLGNVNKGLLGFWGGVTSTQNPSGFENFATSPNRQKFQQAERDLINAILRKESGAVIGESEFANARRQYIPQPGDSDAVLKQKAQNRLTALHGFYRAAGPGYRVPQSQPEQNNPADPLGIR